MEFRVVVKLLEALEKFELSTIPRAEKSSRKCRNIASWCSHYRTFLDASANNALAVASILLPGERYDRVYGLREQGLVSLLVTKLGYGTTRANRLRDWRKHGYSHADLATHLMCIAKEAEHTLRDPRVSVLEIEDACDALAASNVFSSSSIQTKQRNDSVFDLFLRMDVIEMKWLVRLLLKDTSPIALNGMAYLTCPNLVHSTLECIHKRLPTIYALQSDLKVALDEVRSMASESDMSDRAKSAGLLPILGCPIEAPRCGKAIGVEHAAKLMAFENCYAERKYDGERMQIHVDVDAAVRIQIFSKSKKDSTEDRAGIIPAIEKALGLKSTCRFRKCILDAELVVYDRESNCIQEFHRLRHHITRRGRFIGRPYATPKRSENLCAVFFDVLLLDGEAIIQQEYKVRRNVLEELVTTEPGKVFLAEHVFIPAGISFIPTLSHCYRSIISQRCEGLIIKNSAAGPRKWLKLKEDYIPGCGDTADFVCVGGCHEMARDRARNGKDAKVHIRVLFTVSYGFSLEDLEYIHHSTVASRLKEPDRTVIHVGKGLPPMDFKFREPVVMELKGAGFDKPTGASYYTLRFPRFVKLHEDRHWTSAVNFLELQEMAKNSKIREDNNSSLAVMNGAVAVDVSRVNTLSAARSGMQYQQVHRAALILLQRFTSIVVAGATIRSRLGYIEHLLMRGALAYKSMHRPAEVSRIPKGSVILVDASRTRHTRLLIRELVMGNNGCPVLDWRYLVEPGRYATNLNFVE